MKLTAQLNNYVLCEAFLKAMYFIHSVKIKSKAYGCSTVTVYKYLTLSCYSHTHLGNIPIFQHIQHWHTSFSYITQSKYNCYINLTLSCHTRNSTHILLIIVQTASFWTFMYMLFGHNIFSTNNSIICQYFCILDRSLSN